MYNDPVIAEIHLRNIKTYILKRWKIPSSSIESGTFRVGGKETPYFRIFGFDSIPMFDINFFAEGVEIKCLGISPMNIGSMRVLALQALSERLMPYIT